LLCPPACLLALQAQQAADKEQQALQAAAARADKARRLEEQVAARNHAPKCQSKQLHAVVHHVCKRLRHRRQA